MHALESIGRNTSVGTNAGLENHSKFSCISQCNGDRSNATSKTVNLGQHSHQVLNVLYKIMSFRLTTAHQLIFTDCSTLSVSKVHSIHIDHVDVHILL